jgi:hypothetical protein
MADKTISQLEAERFTHIECECRNPACRNNVWYPFKLIREERPRLMLSAMTIAELGARMPCGKCGGRDVLYKPVRQEDTTGYAKSF